MQYHHTNPAKEIEKPLKSANMREVSLFSTVSCALCQFYIKSPSIHQLQSFEQQHIINPTQ